MDTQYVCLLNGSVSPSIRSMMHIFITRFGLSAEYHAAPGTLTFLANYVHANYTLDASAMR